MSRRRNKASWMLPFLLCVSSGGCELVAGIETIELAGDGGATEPEDRADMSVDGSTMQTDSDGSSGKPEGGDPDGAGGNPSDGGGAEAGSSNESGASPCPSCAGCCDSSGHNCSQGTATTECGQGNVCRDCTTEGLTCQDKACK